MDNIVEKIIRGDKRAIARTITKIDDGHYDVKNVLKEIYPKTGNAITIGFTGPGGAGKSTLIGNLIPFFQELGYKIAILAVDPTSPITGGAILGDRVRMPSTMNDESIFMRSIGSRGASGGISKSLRNIIRILDSAGFNLILIESVGAGQLEIEISNVVDITMVVFNPNTGDNIQSVKAGLTEIGDIYIVNKADLDGAGTLYYSLLDLVGDTPRKPVVVKVSAKTGTGLKDLCVYINELVKKDEWIERRKQNHRKNLEVELREIIHEEITQYAFRALESKKTEINKLIDLLLNKTKDPYTVAEELSLLVFSGNEKI